jgi:hypothetical protein
MDYKKQQQYIKVDSKIYELDSVIQTVENYGICYDTITAHKPIPIETCFVYKYPKKKLDYNSSVRGLVVKEGFQEVELYSKNFSVEPLSSNEILYSLDDFYNRKECFVIHYETSLNWFRFPLSKVDFDALEQFGFSKEYVEQFIKANHD